MLENNFASTLFTSTPFKEDNQLLFSQKGWYAFRSLVDDSRRLLTLISRMKELLKKLLQYYTTGSTCDDLIQFLDELEVSIYDVLNVTKFVDQLAGDLYVYAKSAEASFQFAIQLLDSQPPGWNDIRNLLVKLKNEGINYKARTQFVRDKLNKYVDVLEKDVVVFQSIKHSLAQTLQNQHPHQDLLMELESLLDDSIKLEEAKSTLPVIVKLGDAWETILIELEKAIANINIKIGGETNSDIVLTTANLATAVDEWHDAANDVYNFVMNSGSI